MNLIKEFDLTINAHKKMYKLLVNKEDKTNEKVEWIIEEEQVKCFQLIKDRLDTELEPETKENHVISEKRESLTSFKNRIVRLKYIGPGHNNKQEWPSES